MLIPDSYVFNMPERLSLYTELGKVGDEEQLTAFSVMLVDRFGKFPKEVSTLLSSVRLKWMGKSMGFEKISLEKQTLKIYFPSDEKAALYDSMAFMKIMQFIAANPARFELKQSAKTVIMMARNIRSINAASDLLDEIAALY